MGGEKWAVGGIGGEKWAGGEGGGGEKQGKKKLQDWPAVVTRHRLAKIHYLTLLGDQS